jgi:hypothetical protein
MWEVVSQTANVRVVLNLPIVISLILILTEIGEPTLKIIHVGCISHHYSTLIFLSLPFSQYNLYQVLRVAIQLGCSYMLSSFRYNPILLNPRFLLILSTL